MRQIKKKINCKNAIEKARFRCIKVIQNDNKNHKFNCKTYLKFIKLI